MLPFRCRRAGQWSSPPWLLSPPSLSSSAPLPQVQEVFSTVPFAIGAEAAPPVSTPRPQLRTLEPLSVRALPLKAFCPDCCPYSCNCWQLGRWCDTCYRAGNCGRPVPALAPGGFVAVADSVTVAPVRLCAGQTLVAATCLLPGASHSAAGVGGGSASNIATRTALILLDSAGTVVRVHKHVSPRLFHHGSMLAPEPVICRILACRCHPVV